MKRSGFTLVELLAVIAILAILIIIVLPNILSTFNKSKQQLFVTNYQSLYKSIEGYIMNEQTNGANAFITESFSNKCLGYGQLEGYSTENDYYISIYEGKIVTLNISNKDYVIMVSGENIKAEDISIEDIYESDDGTNICPVMSM